jgi:hypothetical protein
MRRGYTSHKKVRNKYCIYHYFVGYHLVTTIYGKGKNIIKNQSLSGQSPFSSVWQAAVLLDCTERRVYHYVQEGRLPLAFDIARPGGRRACLRMATASVVALQRRRPLALALEAFLAGALPAGQFAYKAPRLARLLQCDPDHIYHLIGSHLLEDIGGSTRYSVSRESVIRFLTERRIN